MEIIPYTEKWKEAWDAFVLGSNNGTMFHLQRFLDYHESGKFTFHHLLFVEKGRIAALLPGVLENGVFESPVGASYGSIVTRDIRFVQALEIVDCLLDFGRKQGFREFLLTPAPLIYETEPNQNLDFAMLWRGFRFQLHYISSAIRLDPGRDIIDRFAPTIRRNIRKTLSHPDIRVEINERYDEFYPILLNNKARFQLKPTHSYADLIRLKELLPDRLKLFMVYLGQKAIGGSLMFYANTHVAVCFYNMLLYEYAHLKPIQRVMYEVVKHATENGYRYVDIGVSQETSAADPMTPRVSLIDFKEKFDAKTILRNTFHVRL
ncbi:GNAT family N-acetyltransferase [bacterium]|nr:GNAT family N-acetyltransferase [bacterium]